MALGSLGAMASSPSQTDITIYSEGFGYVKERRSLFLRVGEQTIAIENVPDEIDANSVGVRSLTRPGSFTVVEQNYRFDPLTPESILSRSIGRKGTLSRTLSETARERINGTILSGVKEVVTGGDTGPTWNGLVFKADDGRFILNPAGQLELPQLPKNFYYRPVLLWEVSSTYSGENEVEMSYVTRGLKWQAGYSIWIDQDGQQAEIKGWITLENHTGADYAQAQLNFLHRDEPLQPRRRAGDSPMNDLGMPDLNVPNSYQYSLQRPVDIKHGETKQMMYIENRGIPVERRLVADPLADVKPSLPTERAVGEGTFRPLTLFALRAEESSDLGRSLPPGPVHIFQRSGRGQTKVLGDDMIAHTESNESVNLIAGHSQDVVIVRSRTSFGVTDSVVSEEFSLEFTNHSSSEQTVHLIERNWNGGAVRESSLPYSAIDDAILYFEVTVPANESVTLTYRLDTQV